MILIGLLAHVHLAKHVIGLLLLLLLHLLLAKHAGHLLLLLLLLELVLLHLLLLLWGHEATWSLAHLHTTWLLLIEHHVRLLLHAAKVAKAHAALSLTLTLAPLAHLSRLLHHTRRIVHLESLVCTEPTASTAYVHRWLILGWAPEAVQGVIGADVEQVPLLID